MGRTSAILTALLVMTAVVAVTSPAGAQGFFENLFGLSKPKHRPSPPPYAISPRYPPAYGFRDNRVYSPALRYDRGVFDAVEPRSRSSFEGRRYRTMCVRMCDGYYFPVSFSTPRRNFHRDAADCTSRCGSEARLFYYPNPGGEIEDMVDLTGRAYASLPIAFRHRKEIVQGCRCRPEPWSQEERQRHASYAQPPDAQPSEGARDERLAVTVGSSVQETPVEQNASAEPHTVAGAARAELSADPVPAVLAPQPTARPTPVRVSGPENRRRNPARAKRARPASPPGSGNGGWGWSNSKYVWPGDR